MLPFYLALPDSDADRDKLEYLYTTYYALMVSVAMEYVHDIDAAKDVVQESILRIIRHLDRIDTANPFAAKNFLCAVVKHRSLDWLARRKKEREADDEAAGTPENDPAPCPLEYVISSDGYDFLVRCIDSLSEKCKTVCQLFFIGGLTEPEIADVLELPLNTVRLRIYRGRQALKEMIRESGYYEKH